MVGSDHTEAMKLDDGTNVVWNEAAGAHQAGLSPDQVHRHHGKAVEARTDGHDSASDAGRGDRLLVYPGLAHSLNDHNRTSGTCRRRDPIDHIVACLYQSCRTHLLRQVQLLLGAADGDHVAPEMGRQLDGV